MKIVESHFCTKICFVWYNKKTTNLYILVYVHTLQLTKGPTITSMEHFPFLYDWSLFQTYTNHHLIGGPTQTSYQSCPMPTQTTIQLVDSHKPPSDWWTCTNHHLIGGSMYTHYHLIYSFGPTHKNIYHLRLALATHSYHLKHHLIGTWPKPAQHT